MVSLFDLAHILIAAWVALGGALGCALALRVECATLSPPH